MRTIRACVTVVMLLAFVAISFAGGPGGPGAGGGGHGGGGRGAAPPKPPATPAVPRVVLTLNEGKTVSGEFIEATPAGVTLKATAKSDPVLTPWSTIKHASNGMTRDGIVDEWRKTKRELLCDTCEGAGATTCPTCDGTGIDPTQKKTCEKCEGTGSTGKCKTPHCVDGMIPCPNSCLKADMFTGKPDPADGKRKKQFRGKGGATFWWSEAHIGELIVFEDGTPVNKGKCPRCDGTTKIKDPACNGTGKTICLDCKGHGVIGPDCAACEDGKVTCATCAGTGLKPPASAAPAN